MKSGAERDVQQLIAEKDTGRQQKFFCWMSGKYLTWCPLNKTQLSVEQGLSLFLNFITMKKLVTLLVIVLAATCVQAQKRAAQKTATPKEHQVARKSSKVEKSDAESARKLSVQNWLLRTREKVYGFAPVRKPGEEGC